jgi:hypothetical protein
MKKHFYALLLLAFIVLIALFFALRGIGGKNTDSKADDYSQIKVEVVVGRAQPGKLD